MAPSRVRRSRGHARCETPGEKEGGTPAGNRVVPAAPSRGNRDLARGGAEGDRQHGEQDGQKRGEGIGIGLHGIDTEQDDGQ